MSVETDPQLVVTLVSAVEATIRETGRPLEGTRLGHALGDAYRARGLATGPGAYKPVMEAAIRTGQIKKVWWASDPTRMGLVPIGHLAPPGWLDRSEEPGPRAPASSGNGLYLRRDLFEAFSGRRGPVALDITNPPRVRVVQSGSGTHVEPLPSQVVVNAWSDFAREHGVGKEVADQVSGTLSADPWARVEVPGDTPQVRKGAQFHRRRLGCLVDHVRRWFEQQGKDPDQFDLGAPRRSQSATPPALGGRVGRVQVLRERLKTIIDKMSLEQLCEIRVPAEFLDAEP